MVYHWRLLTAGDTDTPGLKLSPKPSARKVTTSVLQPGTYWAFVSAAGKDGKGPTTAPAALQVVVPLPGTVTAAAVDCAGTGKLDNGDTGANNALVPGGIPQIKAASNSTQARTGLLTQLSAVQSSPRKLAEAVWINLHQQANLDDLFKGSCLTQTATGYATQLRLLLSDEHTTVVTATAPRNGTAVGWDGKQVVQSTDLPDKRGAVSVKLADGTQYWVLWVNGDWVFAPGKMPGQLPQASTTQAEAADATTAGQPASTSSSARTGSQSHSGSGQGAASSGTTTSTAAAAAIPVFRESQQQAVQQAAANDQRDRARASQAATTTQTSAPTTSVAVSTATVAGTPSEVQGGNGPNGSAASASAGTSWSGDCGLSGNGTC